MQHPEKTIQQERFQLGKLECVVPLEKVELWVKVSKLTAVYNYCRSLTGFSWRCRQSLCIGLVVKAQRRGIILVCILAERCPQPVPHNYSVCDSVVRFGISETQTPFSLPLSLSHPSSSSFFYSLFPSASLLQFHYMQNWGERARRSFKGLSPFSLWQPWLCKCGAVTLATALIPLDLKPRKEGMLLLIYALPNCVCLHLIIPDGISIERNKEITQHLKRHRMFFDWN